jgi:hypothetical protein
MVWAFITGRLKGSRSRFSNQNRLSGRHIALYIYAALFLALTILLGVRLGEWDENEDGRCYETHLVTEPSANHPGSDKIYVGISAAWLLLCIIFAVIGESKHIKTVLILALLQYPLHIYFMVVVRTANMDRLDGEESENDWRFGQTVAVLLLIVTLKEVIRGFKDYFKHEKKVQEHSTAAKETTTDAAKPA